ncbi:hypothetical protein K493DRAFT_302069 [Basidiobolus meristosporus CBS 931.73]|uniref:Uncharacterized protein n=1 Tax=Basidiobolus meristosporus CBS 931.73 TaxID=1314790 RepID=A0A1Y1Y8U9_9FUNG|nr:hypothetical protein K493DRAFT_302069 [Basidiobolus meristosporus CBS 931.73]|eukprot:ORX94451.1 hypothetical protein K493DRAFT_302069 [Basidiobolus meristosporus CBS 931.73]
MALRKLLEKKDILHHRSSSSEDECPPLGVPKKSSFSGFFSKGKSWMKHSSTEKNPRSSSKHLLKYLPGINNQTIQRSKSMETFRSQESIQSHRTMASNMEVTGGLNFDEVLKADDTKKVTLTPNRLRSIESREPTTASPLASPEIDICANDFDDFMPSKVKKSETLYEFLKNSGPEDFSHPKAVKKHQEILSEKRVVTPVASKPSVSTLKVIAEITDDQSLHGVEGDSQDFDVYEFLKCEGSDSKKLRHTKSFNVEGASKTLKKIGKIFSPALIPCSSAISSNSGAQSQTQATITRCRRSISEPGKTHPIILTSRPKESQASPLPSGRRRHSTDFSELAKYVTEAPKIMYTASANLDVPTLIQTLPTPPLTPMLSSKEDVESDTSPQIVISWPTSDIASDDIFDVPCMCADCLGI